MKNLKNYYIHKDNTVEFFGEHPVLSEDELLDIVAELAERGIPELTEDEARELNEEADRRRSEQYEENVLEYTAF